MKLGLFLRYNRLRSLYREGVDIFIYLEMVEEIGFQMGSLGPVLQEWAPVRSCPLGRRSDTVRSKLAIQRHRPSPGSKREWALVLMVP